MWRLKEALLIGVGVIVYICILGYVATHSEAGARQLAYDQSCEMKGGQMIPRTMVCIKKEIIIQPEDQ